MRVRGRSLQRGHLVCHKGMHEVGNMCSVDRLGDKSIQTTCHVGSNVAREGIARAADNHSFAPHGTKSERCFCAVDALHLVVQEDDVELGGVRAHKINALVTIIHTFERHVRALVG